MLNKMGLIGRIGKYHMFFLWFAAVTAVCTYGQGYLYDAASWIQHLEFRGWLLAVLVEISTLVYSSFLIKDKIEHPWLLNAALLIVSAICVDAIRILGVDWTKSSTIWTVLIITIIWLIVNVIIVGRKRCGENNVEFVANDKCILLRDFPTDKDDYKRKTLANRLIQAIIEDSKRQMSEIRGAYTFNIDEVYGSGKSSFFMLLEEELKSSDILHFTFLPWRSPSPTSLIKTFFVELQKTLQAYIYLDTIQYIRKYTAVAIENVAKSKGIDISDLLGDLKQSQTDYYYEVADALKKIHSPIVVLVDDVDRLRKDELMSLLCLIRNTADFPYLYFVLAADREYIISTLSSASNDKYDIGIYLQKIINMNILFPSVDKKYIRDEINSLLHKTLGSKGISREQTEKVFEEMCGNGILDTRIERVFNNFRMVNRFFTMLRFDIGQYDDLMFSENLYPQDYVKIELVKYLRPDIYRMLRDYPWNLLESSSKDTRYIFRKDCKIRVSQKVVKFAEKSKREMDVDNGDTSVEEEDKIKDLLDKKEGRNEIVTEYVNQLLSDMFYDDCNYQEELSIRKYASYDFYFTPILHHDIMTFSQFLVMFQSENSIRGGLSLIMQNDQELSYFRNMRQMFQHPEKIDDKVSALKKMFLSIEIVASKNKLNGLSEFDSQNILFDQNIRYVVGEFFGNDSPNKIDMQSFIDLLRDEGFLYSKMMLVSRVFELRNNILHQSEGWKTVADIIDTKSIEYVSNYKEVELKEIMSVDEYCHTNYGSQWLTKYKEHLKICDIKELLYLLCSCVFWNRETNCYVISKDMALKLFPSDYVIFQYLQSNRNEPKLHSILEYFMHKKSISLVKRDEGIIFFGK